MIEIGNSVQILVHFQVNEWILVKYEQLISIHLSPFLNWPFFYYNIKVQNSQLRLKTCFCNINHNSGKKMPQWKRETVRATRMCFFGYNYYQSIRFCLDNFDNLGLAESSPSPSLNNLSLRLLSWADMTQLSSSTNGSVQFTWINKQYKHSGWYLVYKLPILTVNTAGQNFMVEGGRLTRNWDYSLWVK